MMQPAGFHLAEFNFGTLRHDWDDPRMAGFVAGLDRVNALAAATKGFVWRLSDDAMGKAQASAAGMALGAGRLAATLSVWENGAALDHFVWNTLHRHYYGRKAAWYDAAGNGNLVLWWVPAGHRPGFHEGLARWQTMRDNGDSETAFGWKSLKDATLWRERACGPLAAE